MTKEPTTEGHDEALTLSLALISIGQPALSDDKLRYIALALDKIKGRTVEVTDPLADVCAYVGKTFGVTNWQELATALRTELTNIGWQVGPIETPAVTDIEQALREAVEAAVAQFGPDYIRKLSWFPSARTPDPASVDLMKETRKIVATEYKDLQSSKDTDAIIEGDHDNCPTVKCTLAGIKRGMELTPAKPAPTHPLTYEQVIENCARLLVGLGNTYLARELREGNWASLAARTFIAEYRRQTSALTTPDVVTGDMVGRAIGQPTASPILSWSTAHKTGAIHFQTLAYNLNIELLRGRP